MNHLAHVLLAGIRPQAHLGAMLGDFWRGAPNPNSPRYVEAGLRLHRKIDVYTDSHPLVAEARRAFAPPLRRYAGIIIDVYFDYALARDWTQYAVEPIASITDAVLAEIDANAAWLPADLQRFAAYVRRTGLFAAYAERAVIERVFAGIGARLRHANPLAAAAPAVWLQAGLLDECFVNFFPDLQAQSARLRTQLGID